MAKQPDKTITKTIEKGCIVVLTPLPYKYKDKNKTAVKGLYGAYMTFDIFGLCSAGFVVLFDCIIKAPQTAFKPFDGARAYIDIVQGRGAVKGLARGCKRQKSPGAGPGRIACYSMIGAGASGISPEQ